MQETLHRLNRVPVLREQRHAKSNFKEPTSVVIKIGSQPNVTKLPPKNLQQHPTTEIRKLKNKSISQHIGTNQQNVQINAFHQQSNYYLRRQQAKRIIYDSSQCLNPIINKSHSNRRMKKINSVSSNNYDSFLQQYDESNKMNDDNEMIEGKRLYSEGMTEEAQKVFYNVLNNHAQNPEALYLTALGHVSLNQTEKAIEQFQILIQKFPAYKRSVYILLSICLKKQQKIQDAINSLTQGIQNFNKYYDAYILRGKLYIKMKNIEKAIKDFQQAILIQPKRSVGYLGLAECYKLINQINLAIEECNKALELNENEKKKLILIKRLYYYLEIKNYSKAHADVNELLLIDPQQSDVYYFKGLVLQKQKYIKEALLAFEQSIKFNTDKKTVTKSLYEIIKIKIDQNDYYEAQHELDRITYLDIDIDILEKFKYFVEGVIYLMKRKYEEGTNSISFMINKFQQNDHIRLLAYQFRAYGYFCLSKYNLAKNDLEIFGENVLEKSSIYNKLLCYGILKCEEGDIEESQKYFIQAQILIPNKMEPLFYQAVLEIKKYCSTIEKVSEEIRIQYLNNAYNQFQKAVQINEQSNLLFYKGIINYACGNVDQAFIDIENAIEKSEDNQAQHYYVRGLLNFHKVLYKDSLNDFSICISLEQNHIQAHLNRSKLLLMLGDAANAYLDLQKYIELTNQQQIDQYMIGSLFYQIGAFDEAIVAYNTFIDDKDALYYKAKILVYVKELNTAIEELQKIVNLKKDTQAQVDLTLLSILKTISLSIEQNELEQSIQQLNTIIKSKQEGQIFKKSDIMFYKGICYFYQQQYIKAKQCIKTSYNLKEEESKQTKNCNQNLEELEFQNRTYNTYEHLFNISMIDLMLQNKEEAYETLNLLIDGLQLQECKDKINKFIDFIKDDNSQNAPLEDYEKFTDFVLFPQQNRLCSIFQSVQLPLKKYQIQFRLSFCLPSVEFPSYPIQFDEQLLTKISPQIVENKPEAPWIKRTIEGVVFTDNIQLIDDIDLKSTVRETDRKPIEIQQIQQQNSNSVPLSDLKEQLKLDDKITQKLNLILNKNQK